MKALGSLAVAALVMTPLALAKEAPGPGHHAEGETIGQYVRRIANIPEEPPADPRGKVERFFGDLWDKLRRQELWDKPRRQEPKTEAGAPLESTWVPYDPTCHVEGETIGQYVRRIANLDEPPGRWERFSRRLFDRQGLRREAKELLESPEARRLAGTTAAGAGLAMGLVGAGSLGAAGLSGAAATAATLATIGGAVGGGMIAGTGILMLAPAAVGLYAYDKLSRVSGGEGGAEKEGWRDCWEPLLRTLR